MKKFFTLTLALMATISLWAANPNLSFGTTEITTTTFLKTYETEGITISSDKSYSSGMVAINSTPSNYQSNYLQVSATLAIDSIHVLISGNGSNKKIQAPMFGWATTANSNDADTYDLPAEQTTSANGYAYAKWFKYNLTGASVKCARIYRSTKNVSSANPEYTGSSTALGSGQTIQIFGMKIWLHPSVFHTVTINPDEGSYASVPTGWTFNDNVYTKSVAQGSFSVPEGLAKSNYDLIGWKDNHGNTITMPFTLDKDTTLVAQWQAHEISHDATLSALAVNGVNITLEEGDYEYNVEIPWAASVAATYTTNDANATAVPDYTQANKVIVTVTAEDKTSQQIYTVNYTLKDAKKDLLEAKFSNGAKGFITNGLIRVPYIAGSDAPTFVSARFWNADGEPTAVVEEGKLKVTGADGKDSLYNIEAVAITPASVTYDTQITFDSTETYIFSSYGWTAERGWKFAKDVEEANNKRISDGRSRIYIALPKAASVELTSGGGGDRPVKIYVNGVEDSHTKLAKKDNSITVELSSTTANLLAIESNGSNGDGGITKISVATPISTALDNTEDEVKAVKYFKDGQLFIEKNGHVYNVFGACIK